jgi:cGMP-dependent protein kinase 1
MAIISFIQIHKLIGGDIETVLKKNVDSHEKKIAQLGTR